MRYLTSEERAEYDQIFYDATHDAVGDARPTREFGDRLKAGLDSALAAGRRWPQWLLDDLIETGLKRRGTNWLKQSELVNIADGESVVIKKSARMGVMRPSEEGDRAYQQVLWQDMSNRDLMQIIRAANSRRKADGMNIATARKLLDLCEKHGVDTVTVALKLEGASLEEFLRRSA
ncbi:hypothetical protein ACQP1O_42830 (plasmid) [Nocardia sp. CA-151230]|uniref:hypothetical protein n=1 Tax=Nocardia sp. CA-151230 TaxID=3239982 RepID=UPI003D916D6A